MEPGGPAGGTAPKVVGNGVRGVFRFAFAFLALAMLNSCSPNIPSASEPILVRPVDLVRSYRDSRQTADDSYTGQMVLIPVTDGRVRGKELHWHVGSAEKPAMIVFEFAEDPTLPAGLVWVQGRCRGSIQDAGERELPEYTWHIIIAECRLVTRAANPPPAARFGP